MAYTNVIIGIAFKGCVFLGLGYIMIFVDYRLLVQQIRVDFIEMSAALKALKPSS
ncbi:hypothetical protein B0H17DRAFT_1198722 [Mycena rosella]|uniref:Uncharacterized protein n=1 Tax=Mycena rosella TaxID=1033263 RepID=A0AAD7GM39_MYCRO|nr:hypothetical protein B0H17DRAFT_1198722 [Mycena rosella]